MPEIIATSPAPTCFHLNFETDSGHFKYLILISSPLVRACARGARADLDLQRDDQEGVDLLAVEDDEALDKTIGLAGQVDAVEIAAGGKEAHLAIVHDAYRKKVRMCLRYRRVDPLDADWADDVAVAMRFEDVGAPECGHPIDQHAARGRIDDAMRQSRFMAGAAGDQVAALLDEEVRPVLEPVFVDAVDIGGD